MFHVKQNRKTLTGLAIVPRKRLASEPVWTVVQTSQAEIRAIVPQDNFEVKAESRQAARRLSTVGLPECGKILASAIGQRKGVCYPKRDATMANPAKGV